MVSGRRFSQTLKDGIYSTHEGSIILFFLRVFTFLVTGSLYVSQAGLELEGSSDPYTWPHRAQLGLRF